MALALVSADLMLLHRLKQEVGSYALMGDSGFVHLDFLNCCKFAEGDSRGELGLTHQCNSPLQIYASSREQR